MADWTLRVQEWCRRHRLPYVHGCVWDRDCRRYGASPCVYLHRKGSGMIVFELPLPYRGLDLSTSPVTKRWEWNRPCVWTRKAPKR
jgi:hypothetical protein